MNFRPSSLFIACAALGWSMTAGGVEVTGLRADVEGTRIRITAVPPTSEPMAFQFTGTHHPYSLYFFQILPAELPAVRRAARETPDQLLNWLNTTAVAGSNHFFGGRDSSSWADYRTRSGVKGFNALVTNASGAYLVTADRGYGGYLYPLNGIPDPQRLLLPAPISPTVFDALTGSAGSGGSSGTILGGVGINPEGGRELWQASTNANPSAPTTNSQGPVVLGGIRFTLGPSWSDPSALGSGEVIPVAMPPIPPLPMSPGGILRAEIFLIWLDSTRIPLAAPILLPPSGDGPPP